MILTEETFRRQAAEMQGVYCALRDTMLPEVAALIINVRLQMMLAGRQIRFATRPSFTPDKKINTQWAE